MISDIEKVIRRYLPDILHMSLATSRDNKPWVCEVHFSYDKNLNFYFLSKKTRRHSVEIAQNSNISGNIVKQYGLGEKVRGVYFEGKAELLEGVEENSPAFVSYSKRFGATKQDLEDARQEDRHKFYKITVDTFYLFDNQESSGQKYELKWKREKE